MFSIFRYFNVDMFLNRNNNEGMNGFKNKHTNLTIAIYTRLPVQTYKAIKKLAIDMGLKDREVYALAADEFIQKHSASKGESHE